MANKRSPGAGPTRTSNFGSDRREGHDASAFYDRFEAPLLDSDSQPIKPAVVDHLICGDARDLSQIADNSVALVVTSPPYFAGKQYEEELGVNGVPASYIEYLKMLEDVLAESVRTLEPGGRIAVNVANLGRRLFRSLGADVTGILQDRLGLLLRGEVVWKKGDGATGSCAWGSFRKATNPVMRDVSERVIIAAKGRFSRAVEIDDRRERGLPFESTIGADEFMDATIDVWQLPTESAKRVGHPAPFPVELPQRLIEMYTFAGDLVLDPFNGSGSTAVAAIRTGRHYVGVDLDPQYIALAEKRIADEHERLASIEVSEPTTTSAKLLKEGEQAKKVAEALLGEAGFLEIDTDIKAAAGVDVSYRVKTPAGNAVLVELAGSFTMMRNGLSKPETLWRTIAKASVIKESTPSAQLIVLTTDIPKTGTGAAKALAAVTGPGKAILGVVDLASAQAEQELRSLFGS